MTFLDGTLYSCALRAKNGEWDALSRLREDVASRVLPRMIVPPAKDRDERQGLMFRDQGFLGISTFLRSRWTYRPALIDPTYVLDEFGRDTIGHWFTLAIKNAGREGTTIIPCVTLRDLLTSFPAEFVRCVAASHGYFGIVISMAEADDSVELERLADWIKSANFASDRCIAILDFAGADFSDASAVAQVLAATAQSIDDFGPWLQIVFQGSNYPTRNPASPGGKITVARNEWRAFNEAQTLMKDIGSPVIYGDYGADSSQIEFKKAGSRAWPHLRYATDGDWLVVRGAEDVSFAEAMRSVSKAICGSPEFAGSGFSEADRQIALIAAGRSGPGTPTDWRAMNMGHHITRVVADLGKRGGFTVTRLAEQVFAEQGTFFHEVE